MHGPFFSGGRESKHRTSVKKAHLPGNLGRNILQFIKPINLPEKLRVLLLAGQDSNAPYVGRTDALMLIFYDPLGALAGIGVATAYLVPWAMLPDVIELEVADDGCGFDPARAYAAVLYLLSYLLYRNRFYDLQFHRKLWNLLLAAAFILTASAGILLALQINYKWNLPVVKTILKWHVESGIGLAFAGIFHFIWHLSYYIDLFSGWWRYVDFEDIVKIGNAVVFSSLLFIACVVFIFGFKGFPRSVLIVDPLLMFLSLCGIRMVARVLRQAIEKHKSKGATKRVLIMGAGNTGVTDDGRSAVVRRTMSNSSSSSG